MISTSPKNELSATLTDVTTRLMGANMASPKFSLPVNSVSPTLGGPPGQG